VYKEIKELEAAEDFSNPRYTELVMQHYYPKHVIHRPVAEWPEFLLRAFNHLNPSIYVYMQGYSEFGITGDATLKGWDVSNRLQELKIPTLMIGGTYDTMDPNYMKWMSTQVQNGSSVTTNGAHMSQYDDPETYFSGLIRFIKDVDAGTFNKMD
jgi:proline iminopeptidase